MFLQSNLQCFSLQNCWSLCAKQNTLCTVCFTIARIVCSVCMWMWRVWFGSYVCCGLCQSYLSTCTFGGATDATTNARLASYVAKLNNNNNSERTPVQSDYIPGREYCVEWGVDKRMSVQHSKMYVCVCVRVCNFGLLRQNPQRIANATRNKGKYIEEEHVEG